MLKPIFGGIALAIASLLPVSLLRQETTVAQPTTVSDQPQVQALCPRATWTGSYRVQELIPTGRRYPDARIAGDQVRLRDGAGFATSVRGALNRGTPVTVLGEAWDGGCNQWLQVRFGGDTYWVYRDLVATAPSAAPQATLIPVQRQCPEATWTASYHLHELIPLGSNSYKMAYVVGGSVPVQGGAGFDSDVRRILSPGSSVLVTGEAWDSGCNQWMQVQINNELLWIHGDRLQL